MSPTLTKGDIMLVNKMYYGPRVIKLRKLLMEKKIEYNWYKGSNEPRKHDVFVFNWPDYKAIRSNQTFYGDFVVKRCYEPAGDTVKIRKRNNVNEVAINQGFISESFLAENINVYPFDSALKWTIDRYGPFWVPRKGATVNMTSDILKHYSDLLFYEGYKGENRNDSVFLNGEFTEKYTFKENYYFMLGDNFYGSIDSRYWGFVPKKNIVGKAVLILFSLEPDMPWYKKFRWNRFLKRIE